MAIVSVVLGFSGLFSDLGLNSAFVQRRDVTDEERSSLFWLNLGVGLLVMLALIGMSPLLAHFFDDQRIAPLLMISSISFLASASAQQIKVAAEKDLNFRPVVLIELAGSVLGFVAAVLSAISGIGVYALVVGSLIVSTSVSILLWTFLSGGWRPNLSFKIEFVKPFFGFGTGLMVTNLINQANMTIDIFMGGRLLNAENLGMYSVPRNLSLQVQMVVNPIVTRIGFPLIAQFQSDTHRVRSLYLKSLNMTSSINAPLYVGLAFFSSEVAALMLGPGWVGAERLLMIFALWGALRSTGNPIGSLLLGMGRAGLAVRWNLFFLMLTPAFVWGGSKWQAEGIAWAMFSLTALQFFPAWYFIVRPICGAKFFDYCTSTLRPFCIALVSVAPSYFIACEVKEILLRLCLGVVLSLFIYLLLSVVVNRSWFDSMLELFGRRRLRQPG